MSAAGLIEQVRSMGVQLWVDGANLRFRAPQGVLDAELKAQLSAAKSDLIEELNRETEVLRAPQDRFEPFPSPTYRPLIRSAEHLPFDGVASGATGTRSSPSITRWPGPTPARTATHGTKSWRPTTCCAVSSIPTVTR